MTVALYIAGIWKSSALRQGQHGVNKFSTREMFQKKSYCSCTPKSMLKKTAKKQNKPLAPYKCMGNLYIRRRSSCQLCPHRYWESRRCSLTCARRVYVVEWVCKEPAPSSMASVTSAIVKSAMVIGYRTAPKQLWPWLQGCGRARAHKYQIHPKSGTCNHWRAWKRHVIPHRWGNKRGHNVQHSGHNRLHHSHTHPESCAIKHAMRGSRQQASDKTIAPCMPIVSGGPTAAPPAPSAFFVTSKTIFPKSKPAKCTGQNHLHPQQATP